MDFNRWSCRTSVTRSRITGCYHVSKKESIDRPPLLGREVSFYVFQSTFFLSVKKKSLYSLLTRPSFIGLCQRLGPRVEVGTGGEIVLIVAGII